MEQHHFIPERDQPRWNRIDLLEAEHRHADVGPLDRIAVQPDGPLEVGRGLVRLGVLGHRLEVISNLGLLRVSLKS